MTRVGQSAPIRHGPAVVLLCTRVNHIHLMSLSSAVSTEQPVLHSETPQTTVWCTNTAKVPSLLQPSLSRTFDVWTVL